LSEGVFGDDPSTGGDENRDQLEEEESANKDPKEDGIEGHLPIHPDEVSVTVTGGHLADKAITLSEGVGEDDQSIIITVKEGELRKPTQEQIEARRKAFEAEREEIRLHPWPRWRSVATGIRKRHIKGKQAFQARRKQVKRGEYDDKPPEMSEMAEQAEWESVEKGSKLWEERRALFWKMESERLFEGFDTRRDLGIEEEDRKREWKLRHLEIPFMRYPHPEDTSGSLLGLTDNQEAIQEMVRVNPL
jgi:hypothetical protein